MNHYSGYRSTVSRLHDDSILSMPEKQIHLSTKTPTHGINAFAHLVQRQQATHTAEPRGQRQ